MRKKSTNDWTFPPQLAPSIIDTPLPDDEMAPRSETLRNPIFGCGQEAVMDPLELIRPNTRNTPRRKRTPEERARLDTRKPDRMSEHQPQHQGENSR